jgi:ATP-dependent DNA helicase DinG
MPSANELIETAFQRLAQRPGFVDRPAQRQLALFLGDLIEGKRSGAVEAPTGLGKSLAALIPAIAHAIADKRRTVIATYTNVLAEQYWHKDLPLALSLFEDAAVDCRFLIGRQRYACLAAMEEHQSQDREEFQRFAKLGIETEYRRFARRSNDAAWLKISTPPVCPGRLCPAYDDCFYYNARRKAERAQVVITNHSVVIQDALMATASDDADGLLGPYDFLVLDEAHDFIQAAMNGLEFELSAGKIGTLQGVVARLESALLPLAQSVGEGAAWAKRCTSFRDELDRRLHELAAFSLSLAKGGILQASPAELLDHPQVKAAKSPDGLDGAEAIASRIAAECDAFTVDVRLMMETWAQVRPDAVKLAHESVRNYLNYIGQTGVGAEQVVRPQGISVSYVGQNRQGAMLRQDTVGLAEPLDRLIWSRTPFAMLSATLAVDGEFNFLRKTTGAEPDFEEILPSPFDFGSQAAIYLPKQGRIPDPTLARREGTEQLYYDRLAAEIREIILACQGRTLALFHSRKEMEAVYERIHLPPDLPIYVQLPYGTATVGEKFKREIRSTLFALRSFWTGFDAPGETLSCVALVRIPFEVPTDPPAIARLAYLQIKGEDAFATWTLPMAKMMVRQGAGRLIRSDADKGVIALLDPRLRTKGYGEQFLANLPPEMRTFDDIGDAVGWIGLEEPIFAE